MIPERSRQNGSAVALWPGPACSAAGAPSKPVLVVHKGRGQIKSTCRPANFLRWAKVFLAGDRFALQKDGDLWVLSLLDDERFAGQPRDCPA